MSADATVGDLVADRYRLKRELGRGGMATVFLADDEKLNRQVAVKLLHTDLARQPSFRLRFRQEAQSAARLTHPNVVRVFDAGESADPHDSDAVWPFLVMEYIDGELLADRIAKKSIDTAEAIRIEQQILTALEYSHAAGIVHRDIKPGNIMLTATGDVKVMDFGIARTIDEEQISQTTAILGTAAYFSPEQARGEGVDERSDLYSAGIVLFEMLTGKVPFTDASPVRVAYQHLSEQAPAPSSVNPEVSPELDAVVARALTKNKLERFRSASEFSAALDAANRGESIEEFEPNESELFVNQFSVTELSVNELALRQLSESGTEVRTTRRPPVMWFWAGGTLIFALVIAVMFWAVNMAPSGELPSTEREVPVLTGMSQAEASAALKKLDLTPLVLEINDDTVEAGMTVRTDPAAGEIVSEGTKISLYISKGKAAVSIPDVKNQTLDQAKAALTAAGFVPGAENKVNSPTVAEGMVVSTDPVAGTASAPGATININVSTGKVTVPDLVGKSLAEASAALTADALRLTVEPRGDKSCATVTGQPVTSQSEGPGDIPQGSTVRLTFCAG